MRQNSKLTPKKLGIIAIALLILFIPTICAIAIYHAGPAEGSEGGKQKTAVTIELPDGKKITANRGDEKDTTYALFRSLNSGAVPVSTLPADVDKTQPVVATFKDAKDTEVFTYYFSKDPAACYFVDGDRKVYNIAAADAEAFLARPDLAGFLNPGSTDTDKPVTPPETVPGSETTGPDQPIDPVNFVLPVLTYNAQNVIKPSHIEWYTADASGTFHIKTQDSSEVTTFALSSESQFGLAFDIAPDDCVVKAYDSATGVNLYDSSSFSKISLANLDHSTTVRFVISANWKHTENCTYYGNASYTFYVDVDVTVHAQFKINRSTINQGEFVIISGINVENLSRLQISSVPDLNYTPQFFTETINGISVVHTLLPISYGLNKGEYNITVSYGSDSQTFKVNVKDYANGYIDGPTTHLSTYPHALVNEVCTDIALIEYNRLLAEVTSATDSTRLFSDNTPFLDYRTAKLLNAKATLRMGFGRYITITNAAKAFSYEHAGWDFEVASGVEIPAMNSGKVVYVGTSTLLGKCVVIDHGYGLKTWYAHLSEISVSKDDIVKQGQSIGKTGTTGLASEKYRLHIGVTIYDIPVAPDSVFNKDYLNFPKFN